MRVKGTTRKQKRRIKEVAGEPFLSGVTETKGVKCQRKAGTVRKVKGNRAIK